MLSVTSTFIVVWQRLAIRFLQLNLHVREHWHAELYSFQAELALALRRVAQLAQVPKHIVQHHLIMAMNSSLWTSLSMIVPRHAFSPPITVPGNAQ